MIEAREAVWDDGQLRSMEPGDVLALVRTRGALFRELIKAFKRRKLPVAGADRMILREELAVEDCLALMRVALDPADDLSLACVLKGPWLNLVNDDENIFPLAYGREKGVSLCDRLMSSTEAKYANARAFVRDLVARAGADAFSFLSWALETPHFGGPSGWELIFSRLGLVARDPVEELLQRALKLQAHAAPTLQRFLAGIESDAGQVKRELDAETGAIRVMTVHGAKGLEAPVVILPDCTGPPNIRPDDHLIFDETGPYFSQRECDDDAVGRVVRASYKEQILSEYWRLLYVAMTRARDRLVVCGAQHGNSKEGEAPESWRLAVEQALSGLAASPFAAPTGTGLRLGTPQQAEPRVSHQPLSHALPIWAKQRAGAVSRFAFAAPSTAGHGEPAPFSPRGQGQKRFHRGSMIHALLELLPSAPSERRRETGMAWLSRHGVADIEAKVFVEEALRVIDDPQFAPLFGPNSRAEQPIIGSFEGRFVRGIIDRLAIDNERVMILDYKTDRPAPESVEDAPDAYVLQLALYRNVLRSIFPGKALVCALLWTEAPRLMQLPESRLDAALAAAKNS
jgi:ATP-dependent helicase/nuclease subunit A